VSPSGFAASTVRACNFRGLMRLGVVFGKCDLQFFVIVCVLIWTHGRKQDGTFSLPFIVYVLFA
jgi:hypothetical protein